MPRGKKTAATAPQLTEEEKALQDKWGTAIKPQSRRYDDARRKWTVVIFCRHCQKPREIATQDVFQVKTCGDSQCKKALKQ